MIDSISVVEVPGSAPRSRLPAPTRHPAPVCLLDEPDERQLQVGPHQEGDARGDAHVMYRRSAGGLHLRDFDADGGHQPREDDVRDLLVLRERVDARAVGERVVVPLLVDPGVDLQRVPLRRRPAPNVQILSLSVTETGGTAAFGVPNLDSAW